MLQLFNGVSNIKRIMTAAVLAVSVLFVAKLSPDGFAQSMPAEYGDSSLKRTPMYDFAGLQDSSLDFLGYWGWGRCGGVAAMGNYIFTGSASTLLWLDLSNNHQPAVVWDTLMPGGLGEFIIQDSIGYALMGTSLLIVDFRNPLAPAILSTLQLPGPTGPLGLVVEGSLAFTKLFDGPVCCIDISDPMAPYVRSTIDIPSLWGTLALANGNLYVGAMDNEFTFYCDVSNPDSITVSPLLLHSVPPYINSMYARDTLLFVGSGRFHIYSIARPDSVVLLSRTDVGAIGVGGITLQGDTAYYGDSNGRIVVLNISDKRQPVLIGAYTPPGSLNLWSTYMATAGTVLYCGYANGIATLSTANFPSVTLSSFFPTGYESIKVIVREGLTYVTSGYGGLWVVDLSDLRRPRRIGHLLTPGYAYDLVLDGTIGYVSINYPSRLIDEDSWNGVLTVDISQPDSMRVLDSIALNSPFSLSKSGNRLFVTHANLVGPGVDTSLTLLNVEDPSNIEHVSSTVGGLRATEIFSRDSLVFVASDSGMRIYDWSDPAHPTLLSTVLTRAVGVSVSGHFAYVHRRDSTFVVNIEDPAAPVILGGVRHPSPHGMTGWESLAEGNRVIWATHLKFGMIDVSNANEPLTLFEDSRASWGGGIDIAGDTLFVTHPSGGVFFFRYHDGTASAGSNSEHTPRALHLAQNYPNPFNPTTRIRFSVPNRGRLRMEVLNSLGQRVRHVFEGMLEPGEHEVEFDGEGLPSGMYFYKLISERSSLVGKMVLIR